MNYEDKSGLHEVADRINKSVKRGAGLVDGLLQFSRRQIATEFQKVNLTDVVQDTYELIRKSFDQKIDIQIDVPDSLPIMGDPSGLSQALMNLCTNARDAMQDGGRLSLKVHRVRDLAEVVVADSGYGMNRETIEKCFDPFFTTKPVGQGTGLGLSTTYGIVKSHDGLIQVQSDPKTGTTFIISLPLIESNQEVQPEKAPRIARGSSERIMVVDDDEQILHAMRDLLNGLSYRPILANSGKEGLEKYKEFEPEAVLLDINMPVMDGFTFAEKLLDIDSDARIAFVSGYEMNGLDGLKDGVKDSIKGYLTKPVDLPTLSGFLEQLFNSK
jgi:CheY-like chemotaxis protein